MAHNCHGKRLAPKRKTSRQKEKDSKQKETSRQKERLTAKFLRYREARRHFNYSGFPKETPELKFGLRFFFVFFSVQPQFAIKSLIRMRDDLTLMCTWHGVMADEERFMRWKISKKYCEKYAQNGYQIFTQRSR